MDCYVYTSYMLNDINLISVMESFKKNNKDNNITGCLLFNKGNVIQLFEGPIEKTKQLYNNLILDNRHVRFTNLLHTDINERNLPDWNMQLVLDNTKQLDTLQVLSFKNNKIKVLFDSFKKVCK